MDHALRGKFQNLSVEERLLRQTAFCPITGCWIYAGSSHRYGVISVNGVNHSAHRIAYELAKGAIPDGFHIDHICRNTLCVNPDHLRAVTPTENYLCGFGAPAKNKRKTVCPMCGGPYTLTARGWRFCKPCKWEAEKKRRTRIKQDVLEAIQ